MQYMEQNNIPCLIMLIDFEKAFGILHVSHGNLFHKDWTFLTLTAPTKIGLRLFTVVFHVKPV